MSSTGSARSWAAGGVLFAGTLMLIDGLFQIFQGLMALARNQVYLNTPEYTFRFDTTAWGWIHIILGALVAGVGYFLISGAQWARVTAIFLVALQLFTNFFFLPYYPFWTLIVIAIDIFVLWALTHVAVRTD